MKLQNHEKEKQQYAEPQRCYNVISLLTIGDVCGSHLSLFHDLNIKSRGVNG